MSDTPPPPPATPAAQPLSESEERLYATLSHVGIIVVGFIAPLIFWLIGKDRSRFVDNQAKEALNFSILVTIGYVIGTVTVPFLIGLLILPTVWIVSLIFCIQAGMAANKGTEYTYRFNWRIIK